MNQTISRRWWLALLGLFWLGLAGEGQAWERPPMKINTVFQFEIEVKVGPQFNRPTLPWYVYFPSDPRMLPSPQASPYPPFPLAFPPQAPPAAAKTPLRQLSDTYAAPGSMQTQYWPNQYNYASSFQPVGYVPAQAPSYWYNNR